MPVGGASETRPDRQNGLAPPNAAPPIWRPSTIVLPGRNRPSGPDLGRTATGKVTRSALRPAEGRPEGRFRYICEKMKSAGEHPDVVTFNSLSGGAFTKQGDIKNAEEIFEKTTSAGKFPDVVGVQQLDRWWLHPAR